MPVEPRNLLAGTRFADVRWIPETGSTNADVLALARDGAHEGVVLVADHQTAGRGRLGRTWQAPPRAALLVTVLLRPTVLVVDSVTMAVGLAMAEAVEATTGVHARLKWPNDLVVDDRKLAGILAEADWRDSDGGVAVAVGVGVNCNWPDDVPDDLRDRLVACNQLTGAAVDREALLVEFLRRLDERYSALLETSDRTALRADWRARSATLGRRVRVEAGGHDIEGVAVDVTDAGHLVVDADDGHERTFAVGDVTHLRHG